MNPYFTYIKNTGETSDRKRNLTYSLDSHSSEKDYSYGNKENEELVNKYKEPNANNINTNIMCNVNDEENYNNNLYNYYNNTDLNDRNINKCKHVIQLRNNKNAELYNYYTNNNGNKKINFSYNNGNNTNNLQNYLSNTTTSKNLSNTLDPFNNNIYTSYTVRKNNNNENNKNEDDINNNKNLNNNNVSKQSFITPSFNYLKDVEAINQKYQDTNNNENTNLRNRNQSFHNSNTNIDKNTFNKGSNHPIKLNNKDKEPKLSHLSLRKIEKLNKKNIYEQLEAAKNPKFFFGKKPTNLDTNYLPINTSSTANNNHSINNSFLRRNKHNNPNSFFNKKNIQNKLNTTDNVFRKKNLFSSKKNDNNSDDKNNNNIITTNSFIPSDKFDSYRLRTTSKNNNINTNQNQEDLYNTNNDENKKNESDMIVDQNFENQVFGNVNDFNQYLLNENKELKNNNFKYKQLIDTFFYFANSLSNKYSFNKDFLPISYYCNDHIDDLSKILIELENYIKGSISNNVLNEQKEKYLQKLEIDYTHKINFNYPDLKNEEDDNLLINQKSKIIHPNTVMSFGDPNYTNMINSCSGNNSIRLNAHNNRIFVKKNTNMDKYLDDNMDNNNICDSSKNVNNLNSDNFKDDGKRRFMKKKGNECLACLVGASNSQKYKGMNSYHKTNTSNNNNINVSNSNSISNSSRSGSRSRSKHKNSNK